MAGNWLPKVVDFGEAEWEWVPARDAGYSEGKVDVWGSVGSCSIRCFCVCTLLPQDWVGNGQDLWIISRVLAVGGVGEQKSWCLVVSGG